MRRKGDAEGADKWLRIIVAFTELGTPPTDARHWEGEAMRKVREVVAGATVGSKRLVLAVVFTAALAACKTQPSPWSPEVDKLYHQMYGPIIDGG